MTNFEYKYQKYYNKFDNANNIFKKLNYILKMLYYKKNINNQIAGAKNLEENQEKNKEIDKILELISTITIKIKKINLIRDEVLEHDELINFFDPNYVGYNKDDDIIDYYGGFRDNLLTRKSR